MRAIVTGPPAAAGRGPSGFCHDDFASNSSSRNEYYLGGVMALLLQDHLTMSQCQ